MNPRQHRQPVMGTVLINTRTAPTFAEAQVLFQTFLEVKEIEGLRPRTLSDHQVYFKGLVDFVRMSQSENLEEVTLSVDVIRQYILYLKKEKGIWDNHPWLAKDHAHKRGLSPVTINVRLRTLKCFFRYLTREGYMQEDLSAKIKLLKTDKDRIVALDKQQVTALLHQPNLQSYAGSRDYAVMLLLLDTGLRISEALGLTLYDIDLKTHALVVPAHLAKNGKSRELPISPATVQALLKLKSQTQRSLPEGDRLFYSIYGDPLEPSGFRRQLTRYAKRAGIEQTRVSPHVFRHTFAKFYILNGGDAFTLQRLLGHSTMDMVRVYIQMFTSDVQAQHQRYSPVQGILGKTQRRTRMDLRHR
ncbi:tyrosine-type recombinase/integrase [Alicyclobacillus sp. SO9]|uniref:tyrosine-type recombinase/integrase n=1 Tax=Alicyclobacillus sp. SO9 TaxID=2665646 RepID=UPI0018E797EF|nr:tyrosine-type recombinase/integrase [Alicyclobacillus sp. SO9]QQE80608.1 tyrosine-type recombinase/integrase [Alicyclobacillus sp. SO9]